MTGLLLSGGVERLLGSLGPACPVCGVPGQVCTGSDPSTIAAALPRVLEEWASDYRPQEVIMAEQKIATEKVYRERKLPGSNETTRILVAAPGQPIPPEDDSAQIVAGVTTETLAGGTTTADKQTKKH